MTSSSASREWMRGPVGTVAMWMGYFWWALSLLVGAVLAMTWLAALSMVAIAGFDAAIGGAIMTGLWALGFFGLPRRAG